MAEYVKPYIGFAMKNNKKFPTLAIVQALLRYGKKFTWPRRLVLKAIRINVNINNSVSPCFSF